MSGRVSHATLYVSSRRSGTTSRLSATRTVEGSSHVTLRRESRPTRGLFPSPSLTNYITVQLARLDRNRLASRFLRFASRELGIRNGELMHFQLLYRLAIAIL